MLSAPSAPGVGSVLRRKEVGGAFLDTTVQVLIGFPELTNSSFGDLLGLETGGPFSCEPTLEAFELVAHAARRTRNRVSAVPSPSRTSTAIGVPKWRAAPSIRPSARAPMHRADR